jgi:hypothetical protein
LLHGRLSALACEHVLLGSHQLHKLSLGNKPQLDKQFSEIAAVAPPALLGGGLGELIHGDQMIVHRQSAQ